MSRQLEAMKYKLKNIATEVTTEDKMALVKSGVCSFNTLEKYLYTDDGNKYSFVSKIYKFLKPIIEQREKELLNN